MRRRLSLPEYEWTYLRFVRDEDRVWAPAAGVFASWPKAAREITLLDPCMGSGHFLVFALAILVALRRAEEEVNEEAAVMAVLAENLHGLEIDPRCTQIAAFALALTAWKRIGKVRPLPQLHLACSGLAIGMGKSEFVALAERIAEAEGFAGGAADLLGRDRNPMEEAALTRRRGGLQRLYDLFAQAPVLGSMIDPRRALGDLGNLFAEGFDGLVDVLAKVLLQADDDFDAHEAAVTAQGIAKAAELLSRPYSLLITNVPYLGRARMHPTLKDYCFEHYRSGHADLATAIIERFLKANSACTQCFVTPQALLFLNAYQHLRKYIISKEHINGIARLGTRSFESLSGEVINVALITLSSHVRAESYFYDIDANDGRDWRQSKLFKGRRDSLFFTRRPIAQPKLYNFSNQTHGGIASKPTSAAVSWHVNIRLASIYI